MKLVLTVAALVSIAAGPAWTLDCASSTKELARLRNEYKEYSARNGKGGVTFDGLVEILDKIVKLKSEMRKSNCKIPSSK
ncbi:MAG TPA: hypothetical protein VK463_00595 [Desulfomonilaceae bacterium]|nr:hypothetical protein [Desulfomonilaceae bacterium]